MTKIKNFLLTAFIFIVAGEIIVQTDRYFLFFNTNRFIEAKNEERESDELKLVNSGKFTVLPQDLRILILGDSAVYGLGVESGKIFSQQLKLLFKANVVTGDENVYVLNVSCPGYNSLNNKSAYLNYVDRFKPKVVILAYNFNDVYGQQDEATIGKDNSTAFKIVNKQEDQKGVDLSKDEAEINKPLIFRITKFLYNSKLLKFLLVNFNMELKIRGIILPGSEFYHLINKSHGPDFIGWIKSKKHLEDIIMDCHQRGIDFFVYIVPQLNMLDNYAVFEPLRSNIASFFKKYPLTYIDGVAPFRGLKSDDFAVSRYDGHPNARAHHIMAEQVYNAITKKLNGKNDS